MSKFESYDYHDEHDFDDEEYEEEEQIQQGEYVDFQDNYQDDYPKGGSGGGLKILMVAEKNSIAEAISYALSNKVKANKGRNAFFHFSGQFRNQNAQFTVTATNGHLFSRDFPK